MKHKLLALSEESDILASLEKRASINEEIYSSREEIQTWNQDIDSEVVDSKVEDVDQKQCIVIIAEISTADAIEASNNVTAWSMKIMYLI